MPNESQKLILLEDISQIVVSSHDLSEILDNITSLLALRLRVEVCSIYLVEGDRLVLRSTHGLHASAVGQVSMSPEEGLTGLAFQTRQPVNVPDAKAHPRYKFFPGIGEEEFASFLGVPLIQRNQTIGALAVQTRDHRTFSPDVVRLLVTAASQLASVIGNARLLDQQANLRGTELPADRALEAFLRGIGVSPGTAQGVAYPMAEEMGIEVYPEPPGSDADTELARLEAALAQSIQDVVTIRDQVSSALSKEDGAIFHAHLMILEDRGLQDKLRARIQAGDSAAHAVSKVARSYIEAFLKIEDPYLRERAADIRDVAQRLLQHLREDPSVAEKYTFKVPTIVIAEDLTPSRLVRLIQPNLAGVALVRGGRNSHTAILCRSAGIPAVVGLESSLPHVEPGQQVILDGNAGLVYLSPTPQVVQEYRRLAEDSRIIHAEWVTHVNEPAATRDAVRIGLMGNAALLSDIPKIIEAGGEGVGLYRTEFPFLIRTAFPDEEEQLEIYGRILEALDGRPATLRTLDVGGDKSLPYLALPKEDNPHLGWRSIRVSLEMLEPFRIQVRALLRASRLGTVRIVFPMISTVDELRKARQILDDEARDLRSSGVDLPRVSVGAMIEVPSAALSVERLMPLADFFSIGTNDLVQYLLAVDRANRKVAHLYDPLHPVVFQVIAGVVDTCRRHDRPVSVCGEMASRPLGAASLLAAGVTDLSVSPGMLPQIRRLIQTVRHRDLLALRPQLAAAEGADRVREILRAELQRQAVPPALIRED